MLTLALLTALLILAQPLAMIVAALAGFLFGALLMSLMAVSSYADRMGESRWEDD